MFNCGAVICFKVNNMPATIDDEIEDCLDDPISLIVHDVKIETFDSDQVIDLGDSTDEETTCTSSYGKGNFALPVTFFDISNNVKLLTKCRPMSVSIVDCKQYPSYYSKYTRENTKNQSNNSCCENKPNNINIEDSDINVNETIDNVDSADATVRKRSRAPRGSSYYENLKRRKEHKKEMALQCVDLSQVDFKRNKGLVGLKITGNILKNIVATGNTSNQTRDNQSENKAIDIVYSDVENSFVGQKSNFVEHASSERSKSDGDKSKFAKDKHKEKRASDTRKVVNEKKDHISEGKRKEKSKRDKEKRFIVKNFIDDKCKEKSENVAEKTQIALKKNMSDSISSKKSESNVKETLTETYCAVNKTKKDNNGPENMNTDDNKIKSVLADRELVKSGSKLENNNENNQMICSLKISCKKIIDDLKLKQAVCDKEASSISNINVEKSEKETISSREERVPKLNLKRSINNGGYVVSKTDRLECKSPKSNYVVCSDDLKHVEKPIAKDTNVNQEGSNSPVIPCTTITVRSSQPKSSLNFNNNPGHGQKQDATAFPNALRMGQHKPQINKTPEKIPNSLTGLTAEPSNLHLINQANSSDSSNPLGTLKQSEPISNTTVKPKSASNSNHSLPSPKTKKVSKYPNMFIRLKGDSNSDDPAPTIPEQKVSDQDASKLDLPKVANTTNSFLKPASTQNYTLKSLFSNPATYPNPQAAHPVAAVNRLPKYPEQCGSIFRKPSPFRPWQSNAPPNQGMRIQTVINNRPHQPAPIGSRPSRFPPPYPVLQTSMEFNLARFRGLNQNSSPTYRKSCEFYLNGRETGLQIWRSQLPAHPSLTDYRPHLSVPPPQQVIRPTVLPKNDLKNNLVPPNVSDISKDSVIGSTVNGELIKKINIATPPSTVNDKEMMLAELNNAVASPELNLNESRDKSNEPKHKENAATDTSANKKLCPLSKKIDIADLKNVKILKNLPNAGYSPPILPILTYQEILSQKDKYINRAHTKVNNNTPFRPNILIAGLKNADKKSHKRKLPHTESDKSKKKITFDNYRRRLTKEEIDANIANIRKLKNVADDSNQDQGYDSDSTVKL